MKELTRRQREILDFILQYWEKNDGAPSFDEIRRHFGFASLNAVTKHLKALKKKGFLRDHNNFRRHEHRAIQPLAQKSPLVPLLGSIAAGVPIEAVEDIEAEVDLSPLGIDNSNGNYFMLHVKGDSMVNAHILDGDVVIIRKQPLVQNNEIAAVLWNGEATLKTMRRAGRNIILQPANDAMEPIVISPERTVLLTVLGKFVGLIRGNGRGRPLFHG